MATPTATVTPSPTATVTPSPTPTATPWPTSPPPPPPDAGPVINATCVAELTPLYNAETDLSARLYVGLTESAYSQKVGDLSVAYHGVHDSRLDLACLTSVGVPLEDGFNDYVKAENIWNNCISHFMTCTNKSITPKLQAQWSKADAQLAAVAAVWPVAGDPDLPSGLVNSPAGVARVTEATNLLAVRT